MKFKISVLTLLILLFVTPAFGVENQSAPGSAGYETSGGDAREESVICPGVKYSSVKTTRKGLKQSIYMLEFDPGVNEFELESVFAKDCLHRKETVSSMARRKNAVAAVNGAFFSSAGNPLGMIVHQGKIIKEPILGRTVFGITTTGEVFFDNPKFDARFYFKNSGDSEENFVELDGINRPPKDDEIIIFTPEYGNSTLTKEKNSIEIIVAGGKIVSIGKYNNMIPPDGYVIYACGVVSSELECASIDNETELQLYVNPKWEEAKFAVGGGPRLLRDSKVMDTVSDEKFLPDVAKGRAPRTALGVTADKKMLFVCVDGRRKSAAGMTLRELSEYMKSIGAVDAMNLDGGGSTTLFLMGKIMNSPSDGQERPVSQAIVLKPRIDTSNIAGTLDFKTSNK